jgi:hypothetical protein
MLTNNVPLPPANGIPLEGIEIKCHVDADLGYLEYIILAGLFEISGILE